MKVFDNISMLIGNTPIVRLHGVEKALSLEASIYAKVEGFNPAGSAKDRVGMALIKDAEERGLLAPGAAIIEPTSGNTGIGLASYAASRGYRVILTMPDTMSVERRNLLAAFGAEVVLTEGAKGMQGSIDKANELAARIEGSFIPGQFDNPANSKIHYETTGPEIYRDMDGNVDIFVAGVGTGGTITGVGRYLKKQNPKIRVVAVEPASSPLLSGGEAGPHGLQGIGANFVPSVLDTGVYDEIITVTDEDAYEKGRLIASREGFLAGITSGAAVHAAAALATRPENKGKNIVALLPDTGDRYLSTPMFNTEQAL
ncbi:MAG: cysteine synthase A [Anaerovoracaceae bacterium]|nr:cysteine synthase A [Anaerovoracaceae bacterium]